MTTLTLISLFAIGVIAIVFNKKLKRAKYEVDLYRNKLLIEQKENAKNLNFIQGLMDEDRRKSAKILEKNKQIEDLKNQVK